MSPKILIVDDDSTHLKMLTTVLEDEGYDIEGAQNGVEAVAAVEKTYFDLILMDIRMAEMDGLTAQQAIHAISPKIPIIMMTAYASVKTAIKAMKRGAFDYLTKPLDIDELKLLTERALHHYRLEKENRRLQQRLGQQDLGENFIGRSKAMQEVFEKVTMVAEFSATVLISGESGTGKELVAAAIHSHSSRGVSPMVTINCAALPETLLESELFGHEKGAFTGAVKKRIGHFQKAAGSTLFLDEIGEMALSTQAKVLRTIQEKEVQPVGGNETIEVDVRIMAATNKDLATEVSKGRFREDLYYRLNVFQIEVPPLRERREDIPLLADFFLTRYTKENRSQIQSISPKAMDMLMRYDWPGNVRELENTIERSVIICQGDTITTDTLPAVLNKDPAYPIDRRESHTLGRTLKEAEKEMILQTLEEVGGNRTKTAKILGISRRTLQLKLKQYGVN
ncbi:MAG: two-component system response regulator [Deltaproteobacteria bacterium]|nr:MAG: two-component system response regulator [Deltaproteobacteria bacterium]